jgi:hypothetical protein
MGQQYMADEAGIHIATVKRLLAGFEQLGWITRTGELIKYHGRGSKQVEYVLTFYPGAMEEYEEWRTSSPTGSQTSSQVATQSRGKAKRSNEAHGKIDTETEPEPQPETEPEPEPGQGAGQGKGREWGKECDDLLAQVLDRENYQGARNPDKVRKYKAQEYEAIVRYAIQAQPASDLVTWCLMQKNPQQAASRYPQTVTTSVRTYLPELTQAYGARPDCEHCQGAGVHNVRTPDDMGWTTARCVCTGGDHTSSTTTTTPKRVDTGEASNTDIPVPSAEADPQLAMTELTKRLRLPK